MTERMNLSGTSPLSLILRCIAVGFFTATIASAETNNWPRWRGPRDNGSTENGSYPTKWDATTNVVWSAPLPGKGCSTPIVWNERIYVTAPSDGQDSLLAFDWAGKPLWQTPVGPEKPGKHAHTVTGAAHLSADDVAKGFA